MTYSCYPTVFKILEKIHLKELKVTKIWTFQIKLYYKNEYPHCFFLFFNGVNRRYRTATFDSCFFVIIDILSRSYWYYEILKSCNKQPFQKILLPSKTFYNIFEKYLWWDPVLLQLVPSGCKFLENDPQVFLKDT